MANLPNWMTPKSTLKDQFPLDVQSRGRPLTDAEQAFADALEAIFASGVHGMEAVAAELTAAGIEPPGSDGWTSQSLIRHLAAINRELDEAFEESGYGA